MRKIIKSLVLCSVFALSFPSSINAAMTIPFNSQHIQLLQVNVPPSNTKNTPIVEPTVKEGSQVMPPLKAGSIPNNGLPKKPDSQKASVLGSPTTISLLKADVQPDPVLLHSKSNSGCTATSLYSTTTGKPCSKNLAKECASGHLFSFLTGKRCGLGQ